MCWHFPISSSIRWVVCTIVFALNLGNSIGTHAQCSIGTFWSQMLPSHPHNLCFRALHPTVDIACGTLLAVRTQLSIMMNSRLPCGALNLAYLCQYHQYLKEFQSLIFLGFALLG